MNGKRRPPRAWGGLCLPKIDVHTDSSHGSVGGVGLVFSVWKPLVEGS